MYSCNVQDQYAGSSAGNNWSNNVKYANPINAQNLNMQPPLISNSTFQFQCSNSIGMNERDTRSPFLTATPPLLQHRVRAPFLIPLKNVISYRLRLIITIVT